MISCILDLTVREVIIRHPEVLPVFVANGLGVFADDEIRFTLGAAVRLRTVLKAADINADLFREKLDDAIQKMADSLSKVLFFERVVIFTIDTQRNLVTGKFESGPSSKEHYEALTKLLADLN